MKHPIPVTLLETDRTSLHTFIDAGKANARTFTRARILLKADEGWTDQQICAAFDVSRNTSIRVRQLYLEGGLEAVLHDKRQQRAVSPCLDWWTGRPFDWYCLQFRAHGPRPLDRARTFWQSGRIGLRRIHLTRNHPPTAQKNELKPWQHEQWCIPEVRAEFVAAMEDVLDLYEEEYDPHYPTVCFDEKLVVPEADVRHPAPMEPGQPERVDYEYERLGTANLFFFVEPLPGWRHVEMTEHRTKLDYAHCIQWLVETVYPHAEYIRIVQDNLNIHTAAALYEVFEPAQARRILQRVEFHCALRPMTLVTSSMIFIHLHATPLRSRQF